MNSEKLINQIARLCEKQFRKGYQQGIGDFKNGLITEQEADKWRLDGSKKDYKKVTNPIDDSNEDAIERLLAESNMSDMQELRLLLKGAKL